MCDKGFIWNPSDCDCECDKSCDIGEYLDYENCKCKKKLVDKLVEECTENIDWLIEKTSTELQSADNENKHKCSSCIVHIVLFLLSFEINIGIATYFAYYKYMSRNKKNVLGMITTIKEKIINISINERSLKN